jgi:hypothetical protein
MKFIRYALLISTVAFPAAAADLVGSAPRIYIEPQSGLESYIAAGIQKKHVPAVVTQKKEEARFLLAGAISPNTSSIFWRNARGKENP